MRSDLQSQGAERALMREMGLDANAIVRRQEIVGLVPEDLARLAGVRDVIVPAAEELADRFFSHLRRLDEARPLFADTEVAEKARAMKVAHLLEMVRGSYGTEYVLSLIHISE